MAETKRLQEKIEIEIKKKIAEWRARYVTRWNRYCIQAFRRLLVRLVGSSHKYFSTNIRSFVDIYAVIALKVCHYGSTFLFFNCYVLQIPHIC